MSYKKVNPYSHLNLNFNTYHQNKPLVNRVHEATDGWFALAAILTICGLIIVALLNPTGF